MRRSTDWRRAKAFGLVMSASILMGVMSQPAAAQRVVAPDQDAPVAPADAVEVGLDPTDFDPVTITDVEVTRMRSQLVSDLITVRTIDQRSDQLLAVAREELAEARVERHRRDDELHVLERTLGAAAIEGYLSETAGDNVAFFGQYVESDATFADETAVQLVEQREAARQALLAATSALDLAEQRHQIAVARKRQSERSVEVVRDRQDTFDRLAEQQVAAARRADDEAAAMDTEVDLRSVAGSIVVNAAIERQVDRLVADARADGLELSGGGYRTIEAQIALRIAHCGGAGTVGVEPPAEGATPEELAAYSEAIAGYQHYVIYEKPSGACSPPTATPGNSEHQLGLAIDFTLDGVILDRGSDGFLWLQEHAEHYGLLNLPSEAWHWSTDGT